MDESETSLWNPTFWNVRQFETPIVYQSFFLYFCGTEFHAKIIININMSGNNPIKIFAGSGSLELAEKIARSHGSELGRCSILRFSDGEFQPAYEESVRGDTVFIIQSTFPPADHLFELLLMIDAAKRASAYKIVAVIPYFGMARQDRKDRPRCAIGAKLVANLLVAAGVDRVITMDLHADPIQGFFDVPVDHLYASPILFPI
jgi:ribose-phosphate pyrophosphokinase